MIFVDHELVPAELVLALDPRSDQLQLKIRGLLVQYLGDNLPAPPGQLRPIELGVLEFAVIGLDSGQICSGKLRPTAGSPSDPREWKFRIREV